MKINKITSAVILITSCLSFAGSAFAASPTTLLEGTSKGDKNVFVPSSQFASVAGVSDSSLVKMMSVASHFDSRNTDTCNIMNPFTCTYCSVIGKYKNKAGVIADRGACLNKNSFCELSSNKKSSKCEEGIIPIGIKAPEVEKEIEVENKNPNEDGFSPKSKPILRGGSVNVPKSGDIKGIGKIGTIGEYVSILINFSLSFVSIVAVIVLIYGGFMYITSGFDEANAEKGKKCIIGSVIGILIIISSWTVTYTILNINVGEGGKNSYATLFYSYSGKGGTVIDIQMNGGPVELPSSDFSRGTVEYSHGVMIFKCNHIRSIIKSEEKVVTLDRPSQEMEIKCTKRIGDNKDYSIWYAVQN